MEIEYYWWHNIQQPTNQNSKNTNILSPTKNPPKQNNPGRPIVNGIALITEKSQPMWRHSSEDLHQDSQAM